MEIAEAQREVRDVFLSGSVGQLVSGLLWGASASVATWTSPRRGILVVVLGGMLIFPVTQLLLAVLRRATTLSPKNDMRYLAMQVAFTIPLNLPVVAAAALYRLNWFYPACMIVVGTHYLPFIFLYGMWQFGVLAAVLIGGGVTIGLMFAESFPLGAWFTAAALLLFAGWARVYHVRRK